MTDKEETKETENKSTRPNTGYQLSPKNQDENNPTFYYSRDSRLSKAPSGVRELYEIQTKPQIGFFRTLLGDKGRTLIFGSILIICAAMMLINLLDPFASKVLDGNRISVQALKYEDAIIVLVKKTPVKSRWGKTDIAYTGAVDLGASPVVEAQNTADSPNPPVFMHRIFFTESANEEYRFSLPFEAANIIIVFQTEKSEVMMKVKVE